MYSSSVGTLLGSRQRQCAGWQPASAPDEDRCGHEGTYWPSNNIAVIERQIHALYGHVGVGHSSTLYKRHLLCIGSLSICDSISRTALSPGEGLLIARLDHRGRRFRVHLGRLQFGMPKKLLNLLQRHALF